MDKKDKKQATREFVSQNRVPSKEKESSESSEVKKLKEEKEELENQVILSQYKTELMNQGAFNYEIILQLKRIEQAIKDHANALGSALSDYMNKGKVEGKSEDDDEEDDDEELDEEEDDDED
jgi:hypothetical protein